MRLQEICEGKMKDLAYNAEFNKSQSKQKAEFAVMVNGKVWARNGEAISFPDYSSAEKAADKITASRNITTQVVPLRK